MNFNEVYLKNEHYFSQDPSDGMISCIKKYNILPCKCIDIGAGEGRNSLYLAKEGFDVISIEPSSIGTSKIKQFAEQQCLTLKVLESDFLSVASQINDIGFVLALTSLEHMDSGYLTETIDKIKEVLVPGGYIYIVVFTEEDPGYLRDTDNASECALYVKHYFKKQELRNYFSDFEILEYSEYVKEDTSHGPKHFHGKAKLCARKPK